MTSVRKVENKVGQAHVEWDTTGQFERALELSWGRRAIPSEFDQIIIDAGELIALLCDRAPAA